MKQQQGGQQRLHHESPLYEDQDMLLQTEYVDLQVLMLEKQQQSCQKPPMSVWTLASIAIPTTYIVTGILISLPSAYMDYFPRTLNASDAQLSTITVVRALPWSFKVLFGILPDRFPIFQRRFKPYMLLGYAIASFFHLLLAIFASSLTVVSFTLMLLGSMVGIVMVDVMGDALVANRVLKQQEAFGGQLQSIVYMCRFLSEMVGYWTGAILSNKHQWHFGLSMDQLFLVLALIPLLTAIPTTLLLAEDRFDHDMVPSLQLQLSTLWRMLQKRATWQSVSFLAFFNALLLRNSAWGNYLKVAYAFDAFQYGALSAMGASVTFLAIFVYRHYILPRYETPWHAVYLITGVVVAVCSLCNVLLVFHVNDWLGIPPFWFAVGDTAVLSFAKGFQYLPLAIIFVAVCPHNQEGMAFALLTSITNLSHSFAHTISNMLLRLWPVEIPDLEAHEYAGVWKLTVLTSLISLFPLLFIAKLLPRGSKDLERMQHEYSVNGARFVLGLYAVGFIWVLVLSILAIVRPCHVLVGGHGC